MLASPTRSKLNAYKRFQADPSVESFRMLWDMQTRMPELINALFEQMEGQLRSKAEARVAAAIEASLANLPNLVREHAADIVAAMKQGAPGQSPRLGVDYFTPADQEMILTSILRRMPKPKDGVSPDTEEIARKAAELVSVPDTAVIAEAAAALVPPPAELSAEAVVTKVNEVPDGIEPSSVKGLAKTLQDIRDAVRKAAAGKQRGGGGMGDPVHEAFPITAATTSVRTSFPIAAGGNAIFKAAYQGQETDKGVHYTVGSDARTITFDPAVRAQFTDGTAFSVTYIRS